MPPAEKPPISIPADQLQDAGAAGVCVLTAEHECQDTEISSAVTPEHSIFAACHLQTTALMDAALQFDSLCWTDANTAAIIWDLDRVPIHQVHQWLSQSQHTAEGSGALLHSGQEQSGGSDVSVVNATDDESSSTTLGVCGL